jgi:outer membrane protein X
MKKLMMIACMMLFSTAMFAEKGDMFVGAGLSYGFHSDYKNFGIGVKGQYEIFNNFRADAQIDHFFKHEGLSMSDININLQYLLGDGNLRYYPLAGLALVGHSTNAFGFLEEMKAGFNIGAGAELPITDKWKVFAEAKYQIVEDWGRFIPTIGVMIAL